MANHVRIYTFRMVHQPPYSILGERGIFSVHIKCLDKVSIISSHAFWLNNELVADMKWQIYCAEKLERLPDSFQERIKEIMILHSFSNVE